MALEKRLSDNLKARRGKKTQQAFAKKLGISRATLTRLENCAQNTTLKTLEQITKALRCDIADLFNKPSK